MSDADRPLRRVRYFAGQVLSADDLRAEQDYVRERLRRLNRWLVGSGVASGLGVRVEGGQVVVEPGFAIDPTGEELVVPSEMVVTLPPPGDPLVLVLRPDDRPVDPVPGPGGEAEFSRIEEGVRLSFEPPDPSACRVELARLRRGRGGWALDRRFRPRPLRR